ncbi:hypothetical protein MYCTH_2107611 [Thermothelomyces thermophilus ATCC 42464]|uniref:Uncharacterized protein n=1 Tax=Thermothelomyces thermophilus (strain ATCC 42464 / BCRC 31852 / DSM 1799) TaxID=573729 RepID=G2Q0Q8_THET4|nr:uncharacterized protein MYCTH_2107611 [Thermothelomyces thermophilus ATCC 42464]AEO54920.1 hypothetical protein MYCTH_2107611 [Thermothelomyces thermophilus ATCC 42464]
MEKPLIVDAGICLVLLTSFLFASPSPPIICNPNSRTMLERQSDPPATYRGQASVELFDERNRFRGEENAVRLLAVMPSEGYGFSKPPSRATQSTEYDSEEVLCSVLWFSSTLCLKCNLPVRSPEGDVDLHRLSSGAESDEDVIEVNNERVAERMGAF